MPYFARKRFKEKIVGNVGCGGEHTMTWYFFEEKKNAAPMNKYDAIDSKYAQNKQMHRNFASNLTNVFSA